MPDDPPNEVTLTVNEQAVTARRGELLIAAAERNGIYIPRFCWHPRMRSVGMCRVCLVEVDGPRGPAIVPACMQPVADGMVAHTSSAVARKVQEGVLEYLLIHHPLDCPVCDRGGECPLQDQTLHFGPGESRFVEEKRHYAKPIPVNDLVLLDRERCILCDRCVRFAKEIAGDPLLVFTERGNSTQVLTFPDQPFSSYFSANTVQLCPVGALTATPYRFRARPWDLDQAETTCTTCAVGCRMVLQSTRNRLVRYLGVDADPVNQEWLCDKGRFAHEAVDSDKRLRHPLVRGDGALGEATWYDAVETVARQLERVSSARGPQAVGVLGGARLTNEDAYTWAKLAKGVLGTDNVDAQLDDGLPPELLFALPRATIDDACRAATVVLVAPDLKEELPVAYLRLRQAAIQGTAIVELASRRSGLSPYAACTLLHPPGAAHSVLEELVTGGAPGDRGAYERARSLLLQEPLVVILGRPSPAEDGHSAAAAAVTLAQHLPRATFLPALRRGNVLGALDMGLAPGFLPGRVSLEEGRERFSGAWGRVPSARGMGADGMLRAAADGRLGALVLLGSDPLSDHPDRALAREALERVEFLAAVDLFLTPSSSRAQVVLPATAPGEKAGTTTNIEGRVSRVARKVTAPGSAYQDWVIAADIAEHLGTDLGVSSLTDIWDEIERLVESHRGLTPPLLAKPAHRAGIVVPLTPTGLRPRPERMPQEALAGGEGSGTVSGPHSISDHWVVGPPGELPVPDALPEPSGDPRHLATTTPPRPAPAAPPGRPAPPEPRPGTHALLLVSGRKLYDAGTTVRQSPSLARLAPAACVAVNPIDLERLALGDRARVAVTSPRGRLELVVRADSGVAVGSAFVPFNQPGGSAADLIDTSTAVTQVTITRLERATCEGS